MRHFIHVPEPSLPKNKLHEDILAAVEKINRTITGDLDASIKELTDLTAELNKKHPRCHPLDVKEWKNIDGGKGICFSYFWTCTVIFYPIKESVSQMSECPDCLQPASKEELATFSGVCSDCSNDI